MTADIKELLKKAIDDQKALVDRANTILVEKEKLSEERQAVLQEALRMDGRIGTLKELSGKTNGKSNK